MKRKKLLSVIALSSLVAFCGLTTIVSCGEGEGQTQTTTYTVTCASSNDYTITGLLSSYAAGDTVTFTVTPAQGKVITSVTANGNPLTEVGGKYSFAMPEANVTIVVNVTDATYDFVVSYDGNWAVGDFVTVSATIEGTATTDFTIEVTEGSSIATVDATAKTISFSGPGTVTVVVSATHNGVPLQDTTTRNIAGALATLTRDVATNLNSTIASGATYLTDSQVEAGVSDTVNGVTFNYVSSDFGLSRYKPYSTLNAFQNKRETSSATMITTSTLLEVSKVEITYLSTRDTIDNFATVSVGGVSNNTPVQESSEGTGEMDGDYEMLAHKMVYTFNGDVGTLDISGTEYAAYFTEITIYGTVTTLPEPTGISLAATKTSININEATELTATTTPASCEGTISYSIKSGAEHITLKDNKVTGVSAGTAVVNATITWGENQSLVSNDVSIEVSSTDIYGAAKKVTVSEMLDITPTADLDANSDTVLYEVTGIAADFQNNDYGNMTMYDKTTHEQITVYGVTAPKQGFTYEDGTYYFDNDKSWPTIKDSISEGDEITVYALCGEFSGAHELLAEFKEVVTPAEELAVYSIEGTLPEYVTASKSTGLTFGEEVTLTADTTKLPEGQEIDKITHNGAVISPEADGVSYKFNAHISNVIEVTLKAEGSYNKTISITPASLLGYSGSQVAYNTTVESTNLGDITVSYIQIACYGDGLQTRVEDPVSSLWSTTATAAEIDNIQFVANEKWTNTNPIFNVSFGTSVMESSAESYVQVTRDSLTATNTVSGATYFNITRAGRNAAYLDEIIVTLK